MELLAEKVTSLNQQPHFAGHRPLPTPRRGISSKANPQREVDQLYETYVDEAAFQTHMQGEFGKRNFPQIIPLISGKLDSSIFIGKGVNITPAKS